MPIPTDPLLANQWHLNNPNPALLDLNLFGVWNPAEGPAYTGAGTRVFVIDDGFDYNHTDLNPNYLQNLDFDFESNTFDAFGGPLDSHGTAVMGIIGADDDGAGSVGIAHDAELVGYRTANLISDAWLQDVRDAIAAAGDPTRFGDVINISQGISNDTTSEFGAGYNAVRFDEIETSIGIAVDTGRGGLGVTIVKSAGDSRSANYDVNADDWTNDTRQVVVAAVNQDGFVSDYSSYGAAVLVSGFGTPGEVFTTDRVGADGYNGTDFTSTFNGTSAAAPMVSGVVALMYEANEDLGWRDVQSILGVSARHVGSAVGGGLSGAERYIWEFNGASTWNGGGQHFSNDYGYGLVDALAAVRLAETWLMTGATASTSSNQVVGDTMDVLNVATVIPDGNSTGLSFVGSASGDIIVERVTVEMNFSTTFVGDMRVFLTSPSGLVSELITNNGGGTDFNGSWTFETQAFRGERAAGDWTVRVVDSLGGDTLTVNDIVIRTFGASTFDDRYVFTDEYSDYSSGAFGHQIVINDTNGGSDTANASAVTSNSIIRLDGVVGAIDNVAVSFTNIENAIGGDGADILTGNAVNNILIGMRGNDSIFARAGDDTLVGDAGDDNLNGQGGNDRLLGGQGNDVLVGGSGADTLNGQGGIDTVSYFGTNAAVIARLDGGANGGAAAGDVFVSVENLVGTAHDDTLVGNAGANRIEGSDGNDVIYAQAGNDTLVGGLGSDTLFGQGGRDTVSYAEAAVAVIARLDGGPNGGGAGGDVIVDVENLHGTPFDDTLVGNSLANLIEGSGGNDSIFAQSGDDTLVGDVGNDYLNGQGGNDRLLGGQGNDVLEGGSGADTLNGQGGIDTASYSGMNTGVTARLDGGANGGGAAGDVYVGIENLTGTTMSDLLVGNAGANLMKGRGGNDTIYAQSGNDTLIGGQGNDTMFGQGGNDRFIFADAFGTDVIMDFRSTKDMEKIDLSAVSAITDWADLTNEVTPHMTQVGADVVIDDFAGNTITLVSVNLADLHEIDFVF